MDQSSLIIPHLDFLNIKKALQNYIRNYTDSSGQKLFSDYDYEGSNINMLIETLSYNSFFMAYYMNQIVNESFLDTAKKRSSVVSIAKQYNYIPKSVICAKAKIKITTVDKTSDIIFKNNKFYGRNDEGVNVSFSMFDNVALTYNSSTKKYEADINIIQGAFLERTYIIKENESMFFELPNMNIDTSEELMHVKVYPSAQSQSYTHYTRASSVIDLNENSNVYFIQENWQGFYEIYFGNGLIGKKPNIGSMIKVTYFITEATKGNNVTVFFTNAGSSWTIKTIESSYGGQDRESIDSIKYLAPRNYEAQERCVTENDFITILKTKYQSIHDISVWGGDTEVPPAYGKVFISILPQKDYYYTEFQKKRIVQDLIKKYNILTVEPVIVDPDIIYCILDVFITYNINTINTTTESLLSELNSKIVDFFYTELNVFNKNLIYNKLTKALESINSSIESCSVDFIFEKKFTHYLVDSKEPIKRKYELAFSNLIKPGSVTSDPMMIGSYEYMIKDVPDSYERAEYGTIILYRPLHKTSIKRFNFIVSSNPTHLVIDDGLFLSKKDGNYPKGNYSVKIMISSIRSMSYNYTTGAYVSLLDFNITMSESGIEIANEIWFSSEKIVGATVELSCDILTSEEEILNPYQGTVNYKTGLVTLNHFYVTDYSNKNHEIVIKARSGIGAGIKNIYARDQTIYTNNKNQVLSLSSDNSRIVIRPK